MQYYLQLVVCGKIPTLDNGEEAVITFDNDHMISVNEFYNTLKETYGLDTMFVLADTYILGNRI